MARGARPQKFSYFGPDQFTTLSAFRPVTLTIWTSARGCSPAAVPDLQKNTDLNTSVLLCLPSPFRDYCLPASTVALRTVVAHYDMVVFQQQKQRLAVGDHQGQVIIYNMRTATKWTVCAGGGVVAERNVHRFCRNDGRFASCRPGRGPFRCAVWVWYVFLSVWYGVCVISVGFACGYPKLHKPTQTKHTTNAKSRANAREDWVSAPCDLIRVLYGFGVGFAWLFSGVCMGLLSGSCRFFAGGVYCGSGLERNEPCSDDLCPNVQHQLSPGSFPSASCKSHGMPPELDKGQVHRKTHAQLKGAARRGHR